MTRCNIPINAIVEFHTGTAGPAVIAQVNAHLNEGCTECRSNLALVERALVVLREAARVEVPVTVKERAYAIFADRRARQADGGLLNMVARVLFDSRQRSALAGARGELDHEYQLLYRVGDYDVDLWHERQSDGSWYLIGQLLYRPDRAAVTPDSVSIQASDGMLQAATIEGREFHLRALADGRYDLRVRQGMHQIVVPAIEIGGEAV